MSTNPSAASRPTPSGTAAPKSPAELRQSIVLRLAAALDAAALRLQQAASGQSTFANDADLKSALALLKILPDILPRLNNPAPPPAPPPPPQPVRIPLIPKCKICGDGPGAHWTEDCPKNPNPRPQFRG
jgi:hypothetical protein